MNRSCWASHQVQNYFETGGIELQEKEMQCEYGFNKNRIKISIKISTLDLTWNYLKLSKHQLSALEN